MGTLKVSRLSDAEICALYASGQGRVEIGLRAGLSEPAIKAILLRNGVVLRTPTEARQLAADRRTRWRLLPRDRVAVASVRSSRDPVRGPTNSRKASAAPG